MEGFLDVVPGIRRHVDIVEHGRTVTNNAVRTVVAGQARSPSGPTGLSRTRRAALASR
jgi:hypothetical protein